jgi:ubiquinone/menaquinone biosynthesis C-methylase UbiE
MGTPEVQERYPEREHTAFNREFAAGYETWSGVGRGYEASARAMGARLLEVMPHAKNVLEIGAGTGNSGIVLLESAPDIELHAVEPSEFYELAEAKQKGNLKAFYRDGEIHPYSEEMAERLQPHRERLHLKRASVDRLPYEDESMDAIFMCQVFHWLKPFDKALQEIRRVLKPGGVIVFDESGAQFDFGPTKEGQQRNRSSLQNHPFAKLYRENLDQELINNGHKPIQSTFTYLFNLDSVTELYHRNGFELVPDSKANAFTTVFTPVTTEQMVVHESLARMRVMASSPELLANPEHVDAMAAQAMRKTFEQWGTGDYDDGNTYGSVAAVFVARKM